MQPLKHISIPTPCHEDWQQMSPVAQGRHCQSCCKTVIDFTAMSNADIIGYLATHSNTCGRISGTKLAAVNNQLNAQNRKQFSWKGLLAAASLSVLFPVLKADAQSQPKTEQLAERQVPTTGLVTKDTVSYITITGVVKAKDDNLPVPGANIVAKGTGISTQSLLDGSFTLRVPASTKRILISFLGYQTKEIKLKHIEKLRTITLNPILESAMMGGFDVY
ncbi:carboxypeptidase-like regulatory domain-containing protein [Mucilaginibacter psychrotolerans]|nr:carboxypeptidase-like regulatory domain-containing protein [Mucilaginibacter psychrotolerans]